MREQVEIVFKPIKDYEDTYHVSNDGVVKNVLTSRILSPTTTSAGYKQVSLFKNAKRKCYLIHHLVFDTFSDEKRNGRKIQVDHKDNNKLNNHIDNLQPITNRQNSSKDRKGYTSRYVGVSYLKDRGKWKADIYLNNKKTYLGQYDTELEAHNAYTNALKTSNNEN